MNRSATKTKQQFNHETISTLLLRYFNPLSRRCHRRFLRKQFILVAALFSILVALGIQHFQPAEPPASKAVDPIAQAGGYFFDLLEKVGNTYNPLSSTSALETTDQIRFRVGGVHFCFVAIAHIDRQSQATFIEHNHRKIWPVYPNRLFRLPMIYQLQNTHCGRFFAWFCDRPGPLASLEMVVEQTYPKGEDGFRDLSGEFVDTLNACRMRSILVNCAQGSPETKP